MSDKKKWFLPVMIVNLVGILFGFGVNGYALFASDSGRSLQCAAIFTMLALLASLVYLFFGYGKDGSLYFRLFLSALVISDLMGIVSNAAPYYSEYPSVIYALVALPACLSLVLAVAENLGKTKSYVLAGGVLACRLLLLLFTLTGFFPAYSYKIDTVFLLRSISLTVLAAVLCLMVYAKYRDKAARGSH